MDLYQWQQRFEAWLSEHHSQGDAAHDISHFRRVWATAQQLAEESDADRLVILTACYFHDIVSLAKNHPERSRSSAMAAEQTLTILQSDFPDFPPERYAAVLHAIEAHSFSAGMAPRSEEAKIVQDADRLEALGAIGLARVFAVSGALNNILFDADDPFADRRELDDKNTRWITSSASCCVYRKRCRQKRVGRWRCTMRAFWFSIWPSSAPNFAETRCPLMTRFCSALIH